MVLCPETLGLWREEPERRKGPGRPLVVTVTVGTSGEPKTKTSEGRVARETAHPSPAPQVLYERPGVWRGV